MGEIADQMINGEICAQCGVYIDPSERVWQQANTKIKGKLNEGYPIICNNCKHF